MSRMSIRTSASLALLLAGCGTYSMVRPAQTLPKGEVELAAGLAASQLGEVNTILHGAYGITDRVELLAQNEIWNSFVELRYGILKQPDSDVGLVVGAGGGYAVTVLSAISEGDSETVEGSAGTVSLGVGRRWDNLELTLGNRTVIFGAGYLASSTRLGLRLYAGRRSGFMLEAGGTAHTATWADGATIGLGEASLGFFVGF